MNDITQQLEAWREGMVSDGEIISQLIQAQVLLLDKLAEVSLAISAKETKLADERMARIGVPPISA